MTDYRPTTDEVRINTVADITSSHPLYAERLAQFDRWLSAHNRKIAAEALREFADTLGVNVGDEDDEWWRGYRQGQREALHRASDRADRIEQGWQE